MSELFFQGWSGLGRVVLVGVLAYVGLVASLRVSGKRTLAKMNAFDLIVTVALGSTLATVVLSKDVALAEGLLAFALLIALQFVVTWLSVRIPAVRKVVTSEPALLVYQGQLLHARLHAERVTESELRAAIRAHGVGAVEDAMAVVLETDGSFSVIPVSTGSSGSALQHLPALEHRPRGEV